MIESDQLDKILNRLALTHYAALDKPTEWHEAKQALQALLATEYKRGVKDGAEKTMEAYAGFGKIQYERGKVDAERQAIMMMAALLKSNGGKLTIRNSDIVALDRAATVERYEDMDGTTYRLDEKEDNREPGE